LKELSSTCEIDFVASAPAGKEVEELTKKEIFKALREKVPFHQEKVNGTNGSAKVETPAYREEKKDYEYEDVVETQKDEGREKRRNSRLSPETANKYKEIISQMTGSKAAYYLTDDLEPIGKVPLKEIGNTIRESGAKVLILDGIIDQTLVEICARNGIKTVVGTKAQRMRYPRNVTVITQDDLG
ncbi:MAG: hypothetical protein PHU12_03325, partial [Candidatus Aenigmarchaeota archaeon]|nr:hypothetical protein [Candidatus Aenigmarchaeota archaeon]